ncbi:hypothetical protein ACFSUD_06915 [Sulfitobacter aestuarii]|uniref:Uncharacterized protein n=1 Tax=Sulfitobacter aestuarii TaxID=2161676 RepID=A0ABW5U1W2_9RHOB
MKMMMTAIAAVALSAGVASAQTTTQEAVLGTSDDPVYSVQVQGANGVIYNCKPEIVVVDGVRARPCLAAGGNAGLFAAGAGVTGAGAAAAAGVLALVALAASDDDDSTSTSTTD